MNIHGWLARLCALFTHASDEGRFEEEAAAHLEELAAEYSRRGLSEAEARAAARREFGNITAIRESHRKQRALPWLDALTQDLRYALRQIASKPGFAAAAILTLGLGIGANTAIFRVLDAVALRLLPVRNPEQLVVMDARQNGLSGEITFPTISYPLFREIAARQTALSGIFVSRDLEPGESEADKAVHARLVSGTYFTVLGTSALIGRTLLPEDDETSAPVAVVSYGYWRRVFGGDPDALGRAIRVNGSPVTIVGVAPRGFFGESVGEAPDVWIPIGAAPLVWPKESAFRSWLTEKGSASLRPMGRLKPGVSFQRAQAELSALYSELHDLSPHSIHANSYWMELHPGGQGLGQVAAEYRAPLRLLMAIAGLVLLMACCNLANLLLGHAVGRAHEMAVRLALGARRVRLIRQLLTESALLAAAGAGLGFALAAWGSKALLELADSRQSLQLDLAPDARLLTFLAVISTAAVIVFGIAPAIFATRVNVHASLQANRSATGGRSAIQLSRWFVTAQITVSMALVSGAAMLAHSFRNLETQDFGYRQDGLLLVNFKMDRALLSLGNASRAQALWNRLGAIPGVRTAALGGPGPLTRLQTNSLISIPGDPKKTVNAMQASVSARYFETMKIPIVAGRAISDDDRKQAAPVVVLSETAARRLFGAESPVGRAVAFQTGQQMQVVGVAHDIRAHNPREEFLPILYMPMAQQNRLVLLIAVLRTAGEPASVAHAVKAAVQEEIPSIRIESATPVTAMLNGMMQQERALALLSGIFGALGLLLASAGVFGVISYSVQRRTRELGIRLAMGAERAQVTTMLLGEVGWLLAIGLLLGLGGTLALTRGFQSLLFGITAHDPWTLAAAAVLLGVVGLAAGYLPARRAGGLDPMEALRIE
jgi:predicted permease